MSIVVDPWLVREAFSRLDLSEETIAKELAGARVEIAHYGHKATRYAVEITVAVRVSGFGPHPDTGEECLLLSRPAQSERVQETPVD